MRFAAEHCNFTTKVYHEDALDSLDRNDFDTYICESDVIWKTSSTKGFNPGFFLNFEAATKNKRIAYAPSLGRDFETNKEQFKKHLCAFDYLSTREIQSANFLSQTLNTQVECVLDPTLLLSQEEYLKIAETPLEQDYVLVYNCMKNDRQMIKHAAKFAKEHDLKLIEISSFHLNRIIFNHTVKDDLGIEEFLGYFAHAKYVVCNAFHGTCFSLIFNKQLMLFQRDKSDFRMNSIIKMFDMDNVFVKTEDATKELTLFAHPIDYNKVNQRLSELRTASHDFLVSALEGR